MERCPTTTALSLVAAVSVIAYRLLRDVREQGGVSWGRAQARIPDAAQLDDAVTWLHDRGLVAIDPAGLLAARQ